LDKIKSFGFKKLKEAIEAGRFAGRFAGRIDAIRNAF